MREELLKLEIHSDIILEKEILINSAAKLENILYNEVQSKIFVYLSKEKYKKLNKEITEQIDETSFEDITPKNGEPPKVTLEDILSKKVVFVKYNNKEEIQEINNFREKVTKEKAYIIIL